MKTSSHNKLKNITINLKSNIFGQDHAIDLIIDILKINSVGLGNRNKPIGSFLFTGPTGVGKTELAIQLAKNLEMDFKRFDMSEYSEKHSIKNFIGGDAGLVGYENGGLLVNYMIDNPYSILLFDEIEKADSKVLDIFLQILDYGILTSTKGEIVDFAEILQNVTERDRIDSTRAESPLIQAPDAIVLDNSHITRDEQLQWAIQLVQTKLNSLE